MLFALRGGGSVSIFQKKTITECLNGPSGLQNKIVDLTGVLYLKQEKIVTGTILY